jgi:uroporphyrinogen decarboxylase
MIEGGGSKSYTQARRWLFAHPAESHALLALITDVLVEYLVCQVRAGAQALEVFDTWSGELTQQCYDEFVLPYVGSLARRVKAALKEQNLPVVPMTLFPKGSDSATTLRSLAARTDYDLISLDWSTNPPEARAAVSVEGQVQAPAAPAALAAAAAADGASSARAPRIVGLQGNLDPAVLYCSEDQIRLQARRMLDSFGPGGRLVANLGHGMLPDHPLEGLRTFVDEVHKYSPALCKGEQQPAAQQ